MTTPLTTAAASAAIERAIVQGHGRVYLGMIADGICRRDAVGHQSARDYETLIDAAAAYPRDANGNICTLATLEQDARDGRKMREAREQHERLTRAGFDDDSPEQRIGRVIWQYEWPGHIHQVTGSVNRSPRWVRLLAMREWPEAEGIRCVLVRVECRHYDDDGALDVSRILLDLSPERTIDATAIGNADHWSN